MRSQREMQAGRTENLDFGRRQSIEDLTRGRISKQGKKGMSAQGSSSRGSQPSRGMSRR